MALHPVRKGRKPNATMKTQTRTVFSQCDVFITFTKEAMSILTTQPLAHLLARLFNEAESAPSPGWSEMPAEERMRLMHSKTEYLALYGKLKDAWLPVSRNTAALLYMLARSTNAKAIVEFGTSFGISTLHMAAALRENGGGRLITTEFEPSKVVKARAHLAEGGLDDLVEVREGDALKTLASNLPDTIDIVLLDGAKALYNDVLDLIESRLRPGALIIADNADYSPDYLARVRSPRSGYLSTAFADDVELSMRMG
jgi:predicted O-methyltransferase YrrM